MANDTVIVTGVTRTDEYGNLWVTPQGGGEEVKIAAKRSQFHPLFQQGKAVMLHWETYMNRPYVADAKAVEGELPSPQDKGKLLAEDQKIIDEALKEKPAPQAVGMFTKEIGDMIRSKYLIPIWGEEAGAELIKWYRGQGLGITRIPFDGDKLPKFEKKAD